MKVLSLVKDDRKLLEFKISDDRLKLFLSVTPQPGNSDFQEAELLEPLRSLSPEALIDIDVVRDIVVHLNRGEACVERRVAKGRAPEPGLDGRVVWLVKKLGSESEVQTDDRGFADFVQMHRFDNVSSGQKIARLYPPKPGTPGVDATGQVLVPVQGKVSSLRTDTSVVLETSPDEGFDVLVAGVAGYVQQQGESVMVRDTLSLPADLDYHFGSIDFIGNVLVTGDVHKGFSVRSERGIVIRGSLQGDSVLFAREGIEVGGTHFGGAKGQVSTAAYYKVRVARGVRVDADGPIVIDREAIECDLTTRSTVYGPTASIVGGTIRCVEGIEVGKLGNQAGKTTEVHLCVGPEASSAFIQLEAEIRRHEEAARLLKLHLGPYSSLGIRIERINEPQRSKIRALFEKLSIVERSHATLVLKKKHFLETAVDESAVVNVVTVLHAGTVIRRREISYLCTETVSGPLSIKFNAQTGALEKFPIEKLAEPVLKKSDAGKSKR